MTSIWLTSKYVTTWRSTSWWKRTFEGLRGAHCFTLFHRWYLFGLVVFGWVLLFVCFVFSGKSVFNPTHFPVVDRPCLALVRQCRKKTSKKVSSLNDLEFRLSNNLEFRLSCWH